MDAVIVAGGELPPLTPSLEAELAGLCATADLVVAADSGLDHCHDIGVRPHCLVGDLDSADDALIESARDQHVEVVAFPADKDATDLELACELAVERGAHRITVLAAFGGRLDHEVATIGLLTSQRWSNIEIRATDGRRQLWIVHRSVYLHLPAGRTISLVPWTDDVTGVITAGLQWPLENDVLPRGTTRGVSNICVGAGQRVSIDSGVLLVITDGQ